MKMALLTKVRIISNERLDLPDFNNLEHFVAEDFNALFKYAFTNSSVVLSGFIPYQDSTTLNPNPTASPIYIKLEGSTLLHTDGVDVPFMYIGAPSVDAAQIDLVSNATNYIEMSLTKETGSEDTRAFWDPFSDSEFTQIIDTVENLRPSFSVNNIGFSGGDNVPVAEVVMTGAVITGVRSGTLMVWSFMVIT